MIKQQRAMHRLIWLILAPAALATVLYFSRPATNLTPPNALLPAIAGEASGKGALPEAPPRMPPGARLSAQISAIIAPKPAAPQ